MDLPRRILKVVRDQGGIMVWISMMKPEPFTGFVVVYNTESYPTADVNLLQTFRTFLLQYFAQGHGVAAYRRSGRVVFGNFNYFPTQVEAETFALSNKIPYVYNVGTNTTISLGGFEPQLPGDGVSDA